MKKCQLPRSRILEILLEVEEGRAASVVEVCARHGVSRQTFYVWRAKYGHFNDETQTLRRLQAEARELRRLVNLQRQTMEALRQRIELTGAVA